jgi:hypothetical protein
VQNAPSACALPRSGVAGRSRHPGQPNRRARPGNRPACGGLIDSVHLAGMPRAA